MDKERLEKMRHSCEHVLTMAMLRLWPGQIKPAMGPATDDGFYFDFDTDLKISEEDFAKIENEMKKIIAENLPIVRGEMNAVEAKDFFSRNIYKNNEYKHEWLDQIKDRGEKVSVYWMGEKGQDIPQTFVDICAGPHLDSTGQIGAFKLLKTAGAYWHGDEKNKMLTRIYGTAFENQEELENYLTMLEEAKKRDHKKLGAELDLFFMDEKVGKGLPMWTQRGTAVRFALEEFTRRIEKKYGYEHVNTPYLGSAELYKTSGHLDHYQKNMYAPIDMDGDLFYLRPMACPHHIRMYQRKAWSYRDLPVRYAEIADYNRYEKSGELMGMIRVRKFTLTDAHLFVAPDQLKDEFKKVCALIKEAMEGLGLDKIVTYRFSKRDPNNKEKYYPDDELWNKAETVMKDALNEIGFKYIEAEDEAAFYGPKLDVQGKNVNGKEDTLFTAQIDFLLPEKFDITYIDVDGQKKRPVMIHRSVIGALERVFAFLIEHYTGAFPMWLAPTQIRLATVGADFIPFARELKTKLDAESLRVELDESDEKVGKKIRNSAMMKIPWTIVIGAKEVEGGDFKINVFGQEENLVLPAAEIVNRAVEAGKMPG